MAYDSGKGGMVGKTVTTGSRNQNCNDGMAPKDITLPVKPYSFSGVTRGERDTTLSKGGATPKMKE